MDIKNTSLALVLFLSLSLGAAGQQMPHTLGIGDQLPDVELHNMTSKPESKLRLRSLTGNGLLIISFWATWCGPCITEMKFLDSLKAKHPDRFNVLMVTSENQKTVRNFLDRPSNSDIGTSRLNLVTGDTLLRKVFPHKVIPHTVWVDGEGTVKAITSQKEVTTEHILNFGDKDAAELKAKTENINFDPMRPFHLADSTFSYRSVISPYIDGINGGVYGGGYKPKVYLGWNVSILGHYWNAYSNCVGSRRASMIEVDTKDSLKLFTPVGDKAHLLSGSRYKNVDEWLKENAYCYSLTLPVGVDDSLFGAYMFEDLKRQFPSVKATIEKRTIMCSIVTRVNGKQLKPSAETGVLPEYRFTPGYQLSIKNSTVKELIDWWFRSNSEKWEPYPFIIKVEKDKNLRFDMELDFSMEASDKNPAITPDMFYRELGSYGFRFEKRKEQYPILVLRDK